MMEEKDLQKQDQISKVCNELSMLGDLLACLTEEVDRETINSVGYKIRDLVKKLQALLAS